MTYSARQQASSGEQHLQYVVPGTYLLRAGSLSVNDVRNELKAAGLVLCRRFLAHTARSDYLVLFDKKVLVGHFKPDEPSEAPEGSWAARTKKVVESSTSAAPTGTTVTTVEVVAEIPKPVKVVENSVESNLFQSTEPGRKIRPGRRARQMLKDLRASVAADTPEVIAPVIPKIERVVITPQTTPTEVPVGMNILVQGSGPSRPTFRLRPFRVGNTMQQSVEGEGSGNLITVPHLTVYYPPRPGYTPPTQGVHRRSVDTLTLAHLDRCSGWIRQVLAGLVTCGILPDVAACRVMNSHMDASRLSRGNLVSLQCRFRENVPIEVRNAVYAVLRSSVWFQSLAIDRQPTSSDEGETYLVRCWWRQIAPSADDN